MKRTDADREVLRKVGKKNYKPLKHEEFKCPLCKGVASVGMEANVLRIECHACSTWVIERV